MSDSVAQLILHDTADFLLTATGFRSSDRRYVVCTGEAFIQPQIKAYR